VTDRRGLLAAIVVTFLLSGCSGAVSSFDPSGPCTTDGRFPGAYPQLEAQLPQTLGGRPPSRVDSGRNCTAGALATLASHGVTELRYAGGLWEQGPRSGTTLVVFDSSSALTAAWIAEFYEAGARAGRHTESIDSGTIQVDGQPARIFSTLNGDSYQTILVWARGVRVVAALVATDVHDKARPEHDAAVADAVAAFGSPSGAPRP
jgi:hypothetical protein